MKLYDSIKSFSSSHPENPPWQQGWTGHLRQEIQGTGDHRGGSYQSSCRSEEEHCEGVCAGPVETTAGRERGSRLCASI